MTNIKFLQNERWNSLTIIQNHILTFMLNTIYVFFTHLFLKIRWINKHLTKFSQEDEPS